MVAGEAVRMQRLLSIVRIGTSLVHIGLVCGHSHLVAKDGADSDGQHLRIG